MPKYSRRRREPVGHRRRTARRRQQHAVHGRRATQALPELWCNRRSCRPTASGGPRTGSPRRCDVLIDGFVRDGRAELNVDFCAAIPMLTITGSFGVPVEQALDIRQALARTIRRRSSTSSGRSWSRAGRQPQDDLISVLVQAELTDEDGVDAPAHRTRDRLVRAVVARRRARAPPGSRWAPR